MNVRGSAAPTFSANSGIQSINVFANSSNVIGETGVVLGADFTLGGGAVFNSPNAGTFGGTGFIGNGNLDATPGASTFDRDNQMTASPSISSTTIGLAADGEEEEDEEEEFEEEESLCDCGLGGKLNW